MIIPLSKRQRISIVALAFIVTIIPLSMLDRTVSTNFFFSLVFNFVSNIYSFIVFGWAVFLVHSPNVNQQDLEGFGLAALIISPFMGTLIFSVIFYAMTLVRRKFFVRYIFIDWLLPILWIIILCVAYLGTTNMFIDSTTRCLSGGMGIPDDCFQTILIQKKDQISKGETSQNLEEWCDSLSGTEIVFGSNVDFISDVSYRDYCLNAIGVKLLEPNPIFSNKASS